MNEPLTKKMVTDLCERAVVLAEEQIALCPDQDIALDMIDVVRNVLKHRVKDHWKELQKAAKKSATLNAAVFAKAICERVKR